MFDIARTEARIAAFVADLGRGDDGESAARRLCEGLFQAFGWRDLRQAGATLAGRPRERGEPLCVDLRWGSKLWIEVVPRGTRLEPRRRQAFEHWQYHPLRPQYVVLCNFDESWICDFDHQTSAPVDRLPMSELPRRYTALNFLAPEAGPPVFHDDRVAVTRAVAEQLAGVFGRMTARGVARAAAQRFMLRCVVALFAEALGVAAPGDFAELLADPASPLTADERVQLSGAADSDWSLVEPAILGTLFQASLDRGRRHALGAHFSSEADIARVVLPTIVRPWRDRIRGAETLEELALLRTRIGEFRVLDPACGSGDFLFVAHREVARLEIELVQRMREEFGLTAVGELAVRADNFLGIERDRFAAELARVTMLLGEQLARVEFRAAFGGARPGLRALRSWDHLDTSISEADALFVEWPAVDAIVGNPPFQAKNKMQAELGVAYVQALRARYPDVSGMADYCVYWFRRAHDALPVGGRAGLVGTNTIRQNESRESGLAHIVRTGTIVEAVASAVWRRDAAVHVSIVNWVKGCELPGKRRLSWQEGDRADGPWVTVEVDEIGPSLSPGTDLSAARTLAGNVGAGCCYQGQTHGHAGFLLSAEEAEAMLSASARTAEVIFPLVNGEDLVARRDGSPRRFVIDFGERELALARTYEAPFERVWQRVWPDRRSAMAEEIGRNAELLGRDPRARVNRHHAQFFERWWRLSWRRGEMLAAIAELPRYIVCARVARRPIFEFVARELRPGDSLVVFPLADDYSYGILQSSVHCAWLVGRCSTLKRDYRYTSRTVFDSFPWPQQPERAQVLAVAAAGRRLRAARLELARRDGLSRRAMYRALEGSERSPLREAHAELDRAVWDIYGVRADAEIPGRLLALNRRLADAESRGELVVGPGLGALGLDPATARQCGSEDCIRASRGRSI